MDNFKTPRGTLAAVEQHAAADVELPSKCLADEPLIRGKLSLPEPSGCSRQPHTWALRNSS